MRSFYLQINIDPAMRIERYGNIRRLISDVYFLSPRGNRLERIALASPRASKLSSLLHDRGEGGEY